MVTSETLMANPVKIQLTELRVKIVADLQNNQLCIPDVLTLSM